MKFLAYLLSYILTLLAVYFIELCIVFYCDFKLNDGLIHLGILLNFIISLIITELIIKK